MTSSPALPALSSCPHVNLLAQDEKAMVRLVHDLSWPRYRAEQILRWVYRHRIRDIERMTTLSQHERAELSTLARIGRLDDIKVFVSSDGTAKFLGTLDDGLVVETVLIPDGRRLTLCLSTQVGCTLDCTFCLTGRMGLKRNLKAHEIVDQVLSVQDHLGSERSLTNVVLMGMGEPLANLEAVSEAITKMTNPTWGLGIPARRITLSTAGLAPRLKDTLALGVNLAISLNAATDALRTRLMPGVNRLYPLNVLMEACRGLPLTARRRVTFEYVLLRDVNDSDQDAKRLAKLLHGILCKVNLIPFNEFPGSPFHRPPDSHVERFQSILRESGLDVFVRKSKGRDILGACGQLGDLPLPPRSTPPIRLGVK